MARYIGLLPELIEQGQRFTFENFSRKSDGGVPNVFSEDWLVWTHYVGKLSKEIDSPISQEIDRAFTRPLIGNVREAFDSSHNSILNALKAAQRVYGKEQGIPASDRVVTLDHNSPQQKEATEKLDELIEAIEQANDLPASEEEKKQIVAELSAGRRLLGASLVRLAAFREAVLPPLKWLVEKAAGTIVAKIAAAAWDFFVGMHWL